MPGAERAGCVQGPPSDDWVPEGAADDWDDSEIGHVRISAERPPGFWWSLCSSCSRLFRRASEASSSQRPCMCEMSGSLPSLLSTQARKSAKDMKL